VDLVNNTPVLDIKPYIARYDAIPGSVTAGWFLETEGTVQTEGAETGGGGKLLVCMPDEAVETLQQISDSLKFFRGDWERAKRCIEEVLALDIRTLHMKQKHKEGTYGVSIDLMNVSFKVSAGVCTVHKIELWPESYDYQDFNTVKRKRIAQIKE